MPLSSYPQGTLSLVLPFLSLSPVRPQCIISPSLFSCYLYQSLALELSKQTRGLMATKHTATRPGFALPCIVGPLPSSFGYFSVLQIADVQGLCQQVAKVKDGAVLSQPKVSRRELEGKEQTRFCLGLRPAQSSGLQGWDLVSLDHAEVGHSAV